MAQLSDLRTVRSVQTTPLNLVILCSGFSRLLRHISHGLGAGSLEVCSAESHIYITIYINLDAVWMGYRSDV